MQISKNGIDFIKGFETLRQFLYQDGAGNWTIGWGHLVPIDKLDLFKANIAAHNGVFPLSQCETLFNNDLNPTVAYVNNVIKEKSVTLNQNQFDALCSFCFNTGNFTPEMLKRFADNDLAAVGSHILEYIHDSAGNIEDGLVKRRQAESDLFFTPIKEVSK